VRKYRDNGGAEQFPEPPFIARSTRSRADYTHPDVPRSPHDFGITWVPSAKKNLYVILPPPAAFLKRSVNSASSSAPPRVPHPPVR